VVLGLAERDRAFEPGEAPPTVAENDNEVGLTVSVLTGAVIVKVTGTSTEYDSPCRMRTVPL
jgi:hypothetical protein